MDLDAKKLEELGYKQEFKREVSLLAQIGYSFATIAVLPNSLVGFSATMRGGGPMSQFWGYIVLAPFVMCIALGMAEMFSSYPVNGGVYSWCYLLSDHKWGPFMAWNCGYIFLAGVLAAMMTAAYTMSQYIVAIANVLIDNPEGQITEHGVTIAIYVAILLLSVLYCCQGIRFSGYLNVFTVIWVFIGTLIIIIVLPTMAPTHPTAEWVFTSLQDYTGYENSGLAFLLGLLQAGWVLLGYESGAQIAEGTKNADISGPRGILIGVSLAILQAVVLSVVVLFSIQDMDVILLSSFPVATLFVQATNKAVGAALMIILAVSQFTAVNNLMTAGSQMMWAMARDQCLPGHQFWYKLDGKKETPLRILILLTVICIIVILPSFGSPDYWSAIMSTAVICLNVSYGLPYLCRLIWKRHSLPRGPFSLGRYSVLVNVVSVTWIGFFIVILCIPASHPVTVKNMNWSSLMIGGTLIFSLAFWFSSGRKNYKGPMQNVDD
ncbi:amino acid/polyamine transporter I [Fennellomyces sp. T-0311]|nr:amino acid/polyamine transporter I [Fennellomyces sp. T-0311]